MKRVSLLAAAIAFCLLGSLVILAQGQSENAKFRRIKKPIPDQYIVVFHDDIPVAEVEAVAAELAHAHGGGLGHVYKYSLKGFSARMPEAAARAISRDPRVEFVEEDGVATVATTQFNPGWGLDRSDQRNLPLDNMYTFNETGAGINAYVIDTGVRITHSDFGGRAFFGTDTTGGNGADCFGHGTQVAGLIGGSTYGMAKGVRIFNVRVCDCNGNCVHSNWIAGIDWVTNNHVKPAVANQSLGTPDGGATAIDKATRKSIAAGVTQVVCAQNFNRDVNDPVLPVSPARVSQAITVGATGDDSPGAPTPVSDQRASFSNFGTGLDLFAPGVKTPSASPFDDFSADPFFGGTSASSPEVAGAVARYLQTDTTACPSTVSDVITSQATAGVVINPGPGSPNRLLFTPLAWPAPTYRSLSLNGAGAYVSVPNNAMGVSLDITGPLTLEAWVKLNTTSVTQTVIARYNSSAPAGTFDGGYALKVLGGGRARFWVYKNASEFDRITSNTTLVPGVWYHLAGVYDGSQIKIYVNGVLEASKLAGMPPATQTVTLAIGSNPGGGGDPFNGLIDEARVTAAAVYGGNFTPANRVTGVAGTKGLWRFDRQNARDCSDVNNGTLVGGATFSTDVP